MNHAERALYHFTHGDPNTAPCVDGPRQGEAVRVLMNPRWRFHVRSPFPFNMLPPEPSASSDVTYIEYALHFVAAFDRYDNVLHVPYYKWVP